MPALYELICVQYYCTKYFFLGRARRKGRRTNVMEIQKKQEISLFRGTRGREGYPSPSFSHLAGRLQAVHPRNQIQHNDHEEQELKGSPRQQRVRYEVQLHGENRGARACFRRSLPCACRPTGVYRVRSSEAQKHQERDQHKPSRVCERKRERERAERRGSVCAGASIAASCVTA